MLVFYTQKELYLCSDFQDPLECDDLRAKGSRLGVYCTDIH